MTFDSFLPGTGLRINVNIEKIMQKFCGTILMEEGKAFQKPSSLNNMKWRCRVIWKLETNRKAGLKCSQNTFLGKYHLTRYLEEQGFPGGSVIKNPPANEGDKDSIPGLERSLGEGNGNLLQCFCLGNPMNRGVFVDKLMSLLINRLSSFVIVFPPRSKHLLISWL